MTVVYDNWERLVTAVLRREELWLSGLRTPSDVFSLSSASASPSFNFSSNPRQVSSLSSWSLLVGELFTYHQILKATDFLSDSNLIKHGHSGKLFYGVLEGGTEVVVKKVDLSCVENELCFMSELEICGMLYHSRLVPLLGHCLENGHEKFLVYKYTPNKDLASFMRYDKIKQLPSLDWAVRLKIATGVAEGLCYLHDKCFPPLVHRDIQASSILLDDDFEVRLGSLTAVCIEEQVYNQSRIARFLRLPKGSKQTTGTSTASCSYDVYCFGNVLLELVTGNLGVSAADGSSMKDWMENALSYVVSKDKKLILNIVDNSLIIDEHLLMEVWALAFVAKACVQHKPSKRPQMPEILEAVEHIKLTRVSNGHLQPASCPSKLFPPPTMTALPEGSRTIGRLSQAIQNARSSGNSTASWNYVFSEVNANEEVYPCSGILANSNLRIFTYLELKAATRNFKVDTFLGGGAFGRVYKGLLRQKSTYCGTETVIAVKKVYAEYIPQFQRWRVDLHGRISHPNIVKLLGYCWENKELLLVYEFMEEGSLDNHLFGRRGSAFLPLTWEKRIKILVGAARGLAFLHEARRRGLIRREAGNEGFYDHFEPSNVLLDHSYNAKLSDFGAPKSLMIDPDMYGEVHPIAFWRSRNRAAPEFMLAGKSCSKTDVYGFGILLVEVVTGLRALDTRRPRGQEVLVHWIKPRLSDPKKLFRILDSRLIRNYPVEAVTKASQLALKCLADDPEYRPSMEEVVKVLELVQSTNERTKLEGLKNLSLGSQWVK